MRICVFVEGPSERQFLDAIVKPYLYSKNPNVSSLWAVDIKGVGKYEAHKYTKLSRIIRTQICSDNTAIYTTLFDYYAFPKDSIPNFEFKKYSNPYKMVEKREAAFKEAILAEDKLASFSGKVEFHPFLMLHEYETFMYCDLEQLIHLRGSSDSVIKKLKNDVADFDNVELINESAQTAPSKRIAGVIPSYNYQKTTNSLNVMNAIGIDEMLKQCLHFRKWIEWMCSL